MDAEKALSLVGLSPGAPGDQVAAAYRTRWEQLVKAQQGAPTDGLRAKFQRALGDLEQGWRALEAAGAMQAAPAPPPPPPVPAPAAQAPRMAPAYAPAAPMQTSGWSAARQQAPSPAGRPASPASWLQAPSLAGQPPSEAPTLDGIPSPLVKRQAGAAGAPLDAPTMAAPRPAPPAVAAPRPGSSYTGSEDATINGVSASAVLEAGARQVQAERAGGANVGGPSRGTNGGGSSPSGSSEYPALGALSATQVRDLPGARPSHTSASAFGLAGGSLISLEAGRVLANRFEVRRRLGAGGMGAVFAAFDRSRGVEVAIKVLLPELLQDAKAKQRFVDEARVSTELAHPNIVRVYDLQADGDFQFLTMELLKGRNLRDEIAMRLSASKVFTVPEVLKIALALCDALGYAHTRTVHRDVKPENVWMCEDGSVKLMDFGIARMLTATKRSTTGVATGTAYYIAPEQLKGGKDLDGRADEYSLGVLVYELIAGELPLGRMEPLASLRKDVSQGLSRAVDRMLEVAPDKRFPNIAAARAALGAKHASSKAPLVAALAAAAVLLAGLGGWLAFGGGEANGAGGAGAVSVSSGVSSGASSGASSGTGTGTGTSTSASAGTAGAGASGTTAASSHSSTSIHSTHSTTGTPGGAGSGASASTGASVPPSGSSTSALASSASSSSSSSAAATEGHAGGAAGAAGEGTAGAAGESAAGASAGGADPRIAATEVRGRVKVLADRLAEVKQGIDGRLAEASKRLETAQRGASSDSDPARRRVAEAKLADALLEQKALRALEERLSREVFGAQELSEAQGKVDAGERLLREREYVGAAETFARAEPALAKLLEGATRAEALAACDSGRSRAQAGKETWEKLRAELKLEEGRETTEAARALAEAEEMQAAGDHAGAAQRFESAMRGYDGAIDATQHDVDRAKRSIEEKEPGARTAIHAAVHEGNLAELKMRITVGGAIDALDAEGHAPLHLAVRLKNVEAARVLLEGGAAIEVPDATQRRPLHWALLRKDPAMMAFLLGRGASAVSTDEEGDTPLHLAARYGFDEGVRLLLEKGADPNLRNGDRFSPLDQAVSRGGRKMLLDRGAKSGREIGAPTGTATAAPASGASSQ